jgi:hypothetical protein
MRQRRNWTSYKGVTPAIDIDEPFRHYREAGLVHTRFGIDGGDPLFWGYHDPARRWNGWAVPRFCREVAMLIVEWLNESEPDMAWQTGRTLAVRDADRTYVDMIEPDQLGLYQFDGWVWLEVDPNT